MGSINELMQRHDTLQSFRDAREWDKDAQALIVLILDFKNDYSLLCEGQQKRLEQLKQERKNQAFFKRIISSKSDETKIEEAVTAIASVIEKIDEIVEGLYEKMDKTPANRAEQKDIADELRAFKKELALEKREANEKLRQTRAIARQNTANWTGVSGGGLGKFARSQRASIRLQKEMALVPVEQEKKFIAHKLIAIDRDLNWVTHFKADAQEGKSQPLQPDQLIEEGRRCSYCGRRVNTASDICQSCGAVV